ncbi:MAG: site-specific integrase [Pegethrix bostrychoides GSE-TBD4-15B]|jgi:integrase|uniref:Site-specific integrase n=1 Tax=Pegethrix bostrychoides GSE-TBD4-15B TaxID=2839662 RepID=A0A951PC10_9CYAN|nr:site-specific integrase [Pegethrix bostrychoides GSE-TBD4-15B]
MRDLTLNRKASKGSVQIKSSNNRLQLVFNYAGKRQYLSTGFADTSANRKLAEMKARQIELDILSGNFDSTLTKYKPQSVLSTITPVTPIAAQKPTLAELWERYTDFKRPSLSPNTLAKEFSTVERCITSRLPTVSLDEAIAIRDWVVANKSPDAAKRLLTQLSACCKWAVNSGLIAENPFDGMALEVKLPKNKLHNQDQEIDPFTAEERDAIIQAFEKNRYYSHYAPFISFLFKTGCRPSEAIALQWKHISYDFRFITFEQSAVISEKGLIARKGLKTQESRRFPANSSLQAFLRELKAEDCQPESLVFPSPDGKFIDFHNFRNRAWLTILEELPTIRYRKPYQTRHTFITLALDNNLDAKDVARLVGNSPEIIYRHYAGNKRELFVPEF